MSNIFACIHNPYSEGVHNSETSQKAPLKTEEGERDGVESVEHSLEGIIPEREASEGGMNWAEVRNLWGQMALCMAKICLNEDGSIKMDGCRTLRTFLRDLADETDEKIFLVPINKSPFCEVPGMEMIRVQALLVLDHMINENGMDNIWTKQLNISEEGTVKLSHNGANIVRALTGEVGDSNNPTIINAYAVGLLILKSLFTPHRQFGLPTCNMDAIIISETLNNPARLAKIFVNILKNDLGSEIELAGGSMVNAQKIIGGNDIPNGSGFYMKVKVGEYFLQKEDTYKYLFSYPKYKVASMQSALKGIENLKKIDEKGALRILKTALKTINSKKISSEEEEGVEIVSLIDAVNINKLLKMITIPGGEEEDVEIESLTDATSKLLQAALEKINSGAVSAEEKKEKFMKKAVNLLLKAALEMVENERHEAGEDRRMAGIKLMGENEVPVEEGSDMPITGLIVPVKDLNDVLLVNLMQNVYGGEEGVVVTEGFVKSRELYFGISGDKGFMHPIKSTTKENRCFTRYHLTISHPALSQLGYTSCILCDNKAPEKKGPNLTIRAPILEDSPILKDSNSSSNVANLSAKLSNQDTTIPIEISKENLSKTKGILFSIQVKVGNSQLYPPIHHFSIQEIQQLASWAEALKKNGLKVASTFFSQPEEQVQENSAIEGYIENETSVNTFILDKIGGHVENLYLDSIISAPSALKEDGQWMIVGDRNWVSGEQGPVYLVLYRESEEKYVFTDASVLLSQKNFYPSLDKYDQVFGVTGQLCFYGKPSTSASAPST